MAKATPSTSDSPAAHDLVRARADLAATMTAQHPGPWIKEHAFAPLRLAVSGAAEAMKVNRPNLHNVLTGQAALTWDMAYRIEALTGASGDELMAMQHAYDRAHAQGRRAEYARDITRAERRPTSMTEDTGSRRGKSSKVVTDI